MLLYPWMPSSTYNFKADITVGNRPFLIDWLKQYDWLCYSSILKGAFCKFCILFESPIDNGSVKGAFIKTAFCKYKKFQEQAKAHSVYLLGIHFQYRVLKILYL